ncbi:MAG: hypothetical protein PUP91_00375 [Rhizonema sp. PD37]|nr:hypothetical protein [Rhizonema sp. PD37]
METTDLIPGEKYLYTPVVSNKDCFSAEQKVELEVLTYCRESVYERDYHLFCDSTKKGYYVCLFGHMVKSQIEPYQRKLTETHKNFLSIITGTRKFFNKHLRSYTPKEKSNLNY